MNKTINLPMRKRDMAAVVLGVSILVLVGHQVLLQEADALKKYQTRHENGDFAWNHKINDGVLTYMVKPGNDMMFKKMVDSTIIEWETALDEVLVFEKIQSGDPDITFDEVDSSVLGKTDVNTGYLQDVGGATKILGNPDMGTITHIKIRIADLGKDREVEQFMVVKHEFGHALGIFEHSHNPKSVMYAESGTDYEKQKVTECDAMTVLEINYLIDEDANYKRGCYK